MYKDKQPGLHRTSKFLFSRKMVALLLPILIVSGTTLTSGQARTSEQTFQVQTNRQQPWSIPGYVRAVLGRTDGAAADDLKKLLEDQDPRVRMVVAEALGRTGAPAIGPLIRTLHDQDPFVRWAAVLALSQVGMPAIQALMDETHSTEEYRRLEAGGALLIIANGFLPYAYKTVLSAEVHQKVEENTKFMTCGKRPCVRSFAVPAVYPPLAGMASAGGRVKVDLQIDRDGTVRSTKSEGPEILRRAAEDAVLQWTFEQFPPDATFPYPFTVIVDFAVLGDYNDPGTTALSLDLPDHIGFFSRRPRIFIDSRD